MLLTRRPLRKAAATTAGNWEMADTVETGISGSRVGRDAGSVLFFFFLFLVFVFLAADFRETLA
jgi:hypothetical protein